MGLLCPFRPVVVLAVVKCNLVASCNLLDGHHADDDRPSRLCSRTSCSGTACASASTTAAESSSSGSDKSGRGPGSTVLIAVFSAVIAGLIVVIAVLVLQVVRNRRQLARAKVDNARAMEPQPQLRESTTIANPTYEEMTSAVQAVELSGGFPRSSTLANPTYQETGPRGDEPAQTDATYAELPAPIPSHPEPSF